MVPATGILGTTTIAAVGVGVVVEVITCGPPIGPLTGGAVGVGESFLGDGDGVLVGEGILVGTGVLVRVTFAVGIRVGDIGISVTVGNE